MAGKGNPKGTGRPTGRLNKATADIKAVASEYSQGAVTTLVDIMRDKEAPHAARVSAAKEILDRAHGKPTQSVDMNATVTERKTLADFYGLDSDAGEGQP